MPDEIDGRNRHRQDLPARLPQSHRQALQVSGMLDLTLHEERRNATYVGKKSGNEGDRDRMLRQRPRAARGPATAMIEIDRVSQVFQTSGRQDHLALSDISLTIEDGAFVSILGPSGCGKSTLLYIVGGFVNPTEGVAKVKGKADHRARARSRAGVSGVCAVSLEERARQCDVRPAPAGREARRKPKRKAAR